MNPIAASVLLALGAPAPSPPAAPPVAAAEAQRRIERLLCDSYMFNTVNGESTDALRTVHAAALDRRFLETVHGAERTKPAWRDAARKRAWVSPRRGAMLDVFRRSASYWNAPPEADFGNLLYGECVGWRQPREPRTRYLVDGRRFALIDVFAEDQLPALRVLPDPEDYGGLACRVIVADEGRDRIWVCPERGYALVRRIWLPSQPEGRSAEYRSSDFAQVEPGVWLPMTCRCEFRYSAPDAERREFRLEIEKVAVNEGVPDALFEPQFPPGSHVYGPDGALQSSVPGGSDALDLWAAVLVNDYPPTRPLSTGPSIVALTCMTVGTALACLGCYAAARREQDPNIH